VTLKIAMIGGKTSTLGFRSLGVDTFEVRVPSDAPDSWAKIRLEEYAVVFVTEPVYAVLRQDIEALPQGSLPVVTIIPSVLGATGIGYENVRRLVERAVGTDVMARE
jgi:V/A-type H+-transporting ATPase subunit F